MLQLMKIVIFERTDNNGRAEQGLLKTPNSLENSLKDFDINWKEYSILASNCGVIL